VGEQVDRNASFQKQIWDPIQGIGQKSAKNPRLARIGDCFFPEYPQNVNVLFRCVK
jgi:hypothetical protein